MQENFSPNHKKKYQTEKKMFQTKISILFLIFAIVFVSANHHQHERPSWTLMRPDDSVPIDAVTVGGAHEPGQFGYVALGFYENHLIPGYALPKMKKEAYIPFYGKTYVLDHYFVLTGKNYAWKSMKKLISCRLPDNAVKAGYENGKTLYIGRVKVNNHWISGKVVEGSCKYFVPEVGTGKELNFKSGEILVHEDISN